MELEEVKRNTPGLEVLAALQPDYACSEAVEWMLEAIRKHPNITARGLWNACPVGEWLEWLVIELYEADGDDDMAAAEHLAVITKSSGDLGWIYPQGDPAVHRAQANTIRRQYESPWLR